MAYQNFIIVIEMFFAAIAHVFAFPYKVYIGSGNVRSPRKGSMGGLARVGENFVAVCATCWM